jgi:hypothetical protein
MKAQVAERVSTGWWDSPAGLKKRAELSARAKARWAALPEREKAVRRAANFLRFMQTHPGTVTFPERWLADLMGGNGGQKSDLHSAVEEGEEVMVSGPPH